MLITLIPEFTPDLDVNNRRFGPLAEFIGARGYAKLVPHRYGLRKQDWHRLRIWNVFFFSHIPFVGTIPRALVLLFPLFAIAAIANIVSEQVILWLLFAYIGMSISDCLHVGADIIYSFIKGKVAFKEMSKWYWYTRRSRGGRRHQGYSWKNKPRSKESDTWS